MNENQIFNAVVMAIKLAEGVSQLQMAEQVNCSVEFVDGKQFKGTLAEFASITYQQLLEVFGETTDE